MATGSITKVSNDSASGYCKMPDGTLICYGRVDVQSTGSQTVSYPIQFISRPTVIVGYESKNNTEGGDWGIAKTFNSTNTSVGFTIGGNVPSGYNNIQFAYLAIGRWK